MDLDPMPLHYITSLLYPLHLWGILKSISKKKKRKRKKEIENQKKKKRKDILYKNKKNKKTKKALILKEKEKVWKDFRILHKRKHCINTIMHFMVLSEACGGLSIRTLASTIQLTSHRYVLKC